MIAIRRYRFGLFALLMGAAAACGSGKSAPAVPSAAPAGFGGAGGAPASGEPCVVPRGDTEPFVVEWEAAERNKVKQLSSDGVLLAVHSGCGLRFLDGCAVGGGYDDVRAGGDRISDAFDIGSAAQLKSRLPIGYFELYGRFRADDRWTLEYVYADSRKARTGEVRRSDLPPRCRAATHYVGRIMLGAYRLRTAASRSAEAGAGARGVGIEAAGGGGAEIIRQGGDFDRCRDSATPGDDGACQAIVQVYLRPITEDLGGARDEPALSGAGAIEKTEGARGEGGSRGPASQAAWVPISPIEADWGWITVRANVAGVAVEVDGVEVGKTPVEEHKMKAGRHTLELAGECVVPARREVEIASGETEEVTVELEEREGAVAVLAVDEKGKPLRADVYLGGASLGTTSGVLTADVFRVPVCRSGDKIEVRARGFVAFERVLRVSERETTGIQVELEPLSAQRSFAPPGRDEARPRGADIVWQRCPLGRRWNGASCEGIAARMRWAAAKRACPPGYRLPLRQEVADLLGGCDGAVRSGGNGACASCRDSESCRESIGVDEEIYWTASPLDGDRVWRAGFGDGSLKLWYLLDDEYGVRCVRPASR